MRYHVNYILKLNCLNWKTKTFHGPKTNQSGKNKSKTYSRNCKAHQHQFAIFITHFNFENANSLILLDVSHDSKRMIEKLKLKSPMISFIVKAPYQEMRDTMRKEWKIKTIKNEIITGPQSCRNVDVDSASKLLDGKTIKLTQSSFVFTMPLEWFR
uniref:Uncharacterized protein n=1 Tax=Tetranychus urticae TaxID=32264 RepID=T1KF19_TETUR